MKYNKLIVLINWEANSMSLISQKNLSTVAAFA